MNDDRDLYNTKVKDFYEILEKITRLRFEHLKLMCRNPSDEKINKVKKEILNLQVQGNLLLMSIMENDA
ncbi:MAG: hypothetical protein PWQ37_2879 [Candidatus Petromonas sp.]|jgi:hypothetical protein|nr:hypothetical protein [Candidatus Petromonas sp.]